MQLAAMHLSALLKEEIQNYIFEHEADDERALVLKSKELFGVATSLIAQQIAGRRKAKHKLPQWNKTKGILYPPSLNLEQSSSEATASYKQSIITRGKLGADLTGGFGVDSFYLSQQFDQFYYVEPDAELLAIVKHNHQLLGANNIEYINSTAEDFIQNTSEHFDLLYIDPSRRNKQQKVFLLSDCIPNAIELMPLLIGKSKEVLIKNSPLLDIQQGLRELQGADKVIVVAVDNECKELLFSVKRQLNSSPQIEAIDLDNNGNTSQSFSYTRDEEHLTIPRFSQPLEFLYEPNAAILKAGAFKTLVVRYSVFKLHSSTHLYTHKEQLTSFPGRTFKVLQQVKLDKSIVTNFPKGYANIITRNYPLSVEEIKKKTGLKEGGELYLICTQSEREKHVLIAERLS